MAVRIDVYPTPDELAIAAAENWITLANAAADANKTFHIALSGGTTPKRLYELMAQTAYANRINWENVHVYFGDERLVASDHADSNFRMANEALLSLVPIPSENIHRVETELGDAGKTARLYEKCIQENVPSVQNRACFDLVLLGLGADGHTASLFPETPALDEDRKLVTDVFVKKLDSTRITLTFPVINNAAHVLFLVEGAGKAQIIEEILGDPNAKARYPAQRVKPRGELTWMLDRAAGEKLDLA